VPAEGEEAWHWLHDYVGTDYDIILEVRRKVADALGSNVLPHFTDHSIAHSDRVIEIVHRLVDRNLTAAGDVVLTADELFILALAVLLHDVGMQLPKSHGIDSPVSELTREDLSKVRRDHGEVSGKVIRDMLNGDGDVLKLGLTQHHFTKRLPVVASLCERHQSAVQYNPEERTKIAQGTVRVGLLIAILRIADQLDCDFRRVNLDRLDHYAIPIESIVHWLVCSYVDAVTIEDGLVEICASFPEAMTGPEVEYFSSLLILKLRAEYKMAENMLWHNNVAVRVPDTVVKTQTDFTHKKRPLPPEVVAYIDGKLTSTGPTHVVAGPTKPGPNGEIDWMSYWRVVGNPFLDRPVAYGMNKFVETMELKRMMAEVGSFLKGSEGELKLLVAPRGMGKTTLFQSLGSRYSEKFDIVIIDVAEQVPTVHAVADLQAMVFYEVERRISSEPSRTAEHLVEAARLGNKKVICVDSLDRLPPNQEDLVRDFFKTAQHTLTRLRAVSVVLIACGETWGRFLASDELSYLGFRNQWTLAPFTPDDIKEMLDRRLVACGSSYLKIFEPGCTAVLCTQSGGNPRKVLEQAEAICRLAALKTQARVTPNFIREQYQKDFNRAIERLLTKLAASSKEIEKALESIYHYYLEMERRGLPTNEGWAYLVELVEKGLQQNKVPAAYWAPLKYVSTSTVEKQGGGPWDLMLSAPGALKSFFKELRKEGYTVRDFIAFYATNPFIPGGKDDDLEVRFKSPLLSGPDVEYFEKARQLFISTKRSTGPAFQVISDSWDCVENMIFALLLKAKFGGTERILAEKDSWLVPDRYGVPRFVKGAGKLRADYAYRLTELFSDWRKQRRVWLTSWISLKWIRDARANVVRGSAHHLAEFGEREKDLCLRHLDTVYRELNRVYG